MTILHRCILGVKVVLQMILKWLAVSASLMVTLWYATYWDTDASRYLRSLSSEIWVDVANRSIFEGDALGLSDISIFIFIAALIRFIFSFLVQHQMPSLQLRIRLNFLLISVISYTALVHLIKGVLGRRRPFQFVSDPQLIDVQSFLSPVNWTLDGWGKGSFPSGHTATMVCLFSLLAFAKNSLHRFVVFSVILILIVLMAMARIASQSHWLSDTIGSVVLGSFLIALLYYRILRVSELSNKIENLSISSSKSFSLRWQWQQMAFLILLIICAFIPLIFISSELAEWLKWALVLLSALILGTGLYQINKRALDHIKNIGEVN